jgi:hypothetical protein
MKCDRSPNILSVVRHVDQLIALNDVALVESLYRTLLELPPDPEGMEFYVGQLRAGYDKVLLIAEFAAMPQAQAAGLALPGLQKFIVRQKKREQSLWRRISGNRQHESQLNRLENNIGQVLHELENLKHEMQRRLGAIDDSVHSTPADGGDRDGEMQDGRHLAPDATMQPEAAAGELELDGLPPAARKIFSELSAAIEAIDKPKSM